MCEGEETLEQLSGWNPFLHCSTPFLAWPLAGFNKLKYNGMQSSFLKKNNIEDLNGDEIKE